MDCPVCAREGMHSRLTVRDTRQDPSALKITRRRICEHDAGHVIDTVEAPSGVSLDQLAVRRSSDGALAGPFSPARLERDVKKMVLKSIRSVDVDHVVRDVYAALRQNVTRYYKALTPEEQAGPAGLEFEGVITDEQIASEVEQRLQLEPNKTAYVLYVLATRAFSERSDTARDFLEWLQNSGNAQHLDINVPAYVATRPVDRWWHPGPPPSIPVTVIKKNGDIPKFSRKKFRDSVDAALIGRSGRSLKVEGVVEWVLWSVCGQRTVTSTQLSSAVMQILRRVDDLGFLRWCSIAKSFDSLDQLVDEAMGLIEYPSPKLEFDESMVRAVAPADDVVVATRSVQADVA